MTKTGARKTMAIPPHMIPNKDKGRTRDQFREVQIPLHDYVDDRPPPPGWKRDGTRDDGTDGQRKYNPDVPRWNF